MTKQEKAEAKRQRRAERNIRSGQHSRYALENVTDKAAALRDIWPRKRAYHRSPAAFGFHDPATALATIPALLAMSAHGKRKAPEADAGASQ